MAVLIASGVLIVSAAPAHARRPVAFILMDADTGAVLKASRADERRYPASLTKLMTLYLVFEALDEHRVSMHTRFRVSAHAASREPTKLGLHPGQRISVRDLILGLVTESANDAASVLAEGLGGTESAFARAMTRKARKLGMTRTVFRNASGLPNPRQVTTARDMARLARRLIRDFPRRYHYFSTLAFKYHGRTYYNHNQFMKQYDGADGLKTGFTVAAGFNLVASAVRHGHRLIGVILSTPSPRARLAKMTGLFNWGFGRRSVVEVADAGASRHLADDARRIVADLAPVSVAEAAPIRAPRSHKAGRPKRLWSIQVGAFAHIAAATRLAARLVHGNPALAARRRRIIRRRVKRRSLFLVRFVDFPHARATSVCKTLRQKHQDCLVLAQSG